MNHLIPDTVLSMTGQGHAEQQTELGTVAVEVRTVNNRGFKCSPRVGDSLGSLESRIEAVARSLIYRGSVQLTVSWRRPAGKGLPKIDVDALQAYHAQLQMAQTAIDGDDQAATIDLTQLLALPGVMLSSREDHSENTELWDLVRDSVTAAIDNLNQMRAAEGARMAVTLRGECDLIRIRLTAVEKLAPRTIDVYRKRLETKIRRALDEQNLDSDPIDILREVQIYADRADISEEITRLASHLLMFDSALEGNIDEHSGHQAVGPEADVDSLKRREPCGRKLDFIIQEMFRETNTIGSKASDAEISAHVVEIKCAIERMRELVQNLE